jgi:calcineurin-like phosphoesterase family protein
VGDFGLWPPDENADRWLLRLDMIVEDAGLDAIHFVDGNHDWHDRLGIYRDLAERDSDGFLICSPARRVRYADRGHRWTMDGLRWGAVGGAFSIDHAGRTRFVSWWPDEQPTEADFERLGRSGELDILLCHEAPTGVFEDEGYPLPPRDQEAADSTRRLIRQAVSRLAPQLLVHGHWHIRRTTELHTRILFDEHFEPRRFSTRVESLAANINDHADAWLVVDLDGLRRHD